MTWCPRLSWYLFSEVCINVFICSSQHLIKESVSNALINNVYTQSCFSVCERKAKRLLKHAEHSYFSSSSGNTPKLPKIRTFSHTNTYITSVCSCVIVCPFPIHSLYVRLVVCWRFIQSWNSCMGLHGDINMFLFHSFPISILSATNYADLQSGW